MERVRDYANNYVHVSILCNELYLFVIKLDCRTYALLKVLNLQDSLNV